MDVEEALAWIDDLVTAQRGEGLSELQRVILQQVWQGQKYFDIANIYGCTEGHAKDVGSDLWKFLSAALGEKITKKNLRLVLTKRIPLQTYYLSTKSEVSPNFVGRQSAMAQLDQWVQQGAVAIALQGESGVGKTTLAQQYLQRQDYELSLELLMAKETSSIASVERVVEEWLTRDLQDEPGLELGISLDRLRRHLQQRRIGILIDNLEPVLGPQGLFIPEHHRYLELFRVLTDTRNQGLTLVTSRDRICDSSLTLQHYRLPGLAMAAWQQYFQFQDLATHTPLLTQLHRAYGGNAKAMTLLCGAIQSDYAGDLTAFWHDQQQNLLLAADLKNLINSQINRLQRLDPPAYQLFCRLGCYRCQTVSRLSTAGLLALLWDIPQPERRAKITSLQNRSLVECHKGQYWLHPVTREAAITRLRQSPDWEQTHRYAAQYWTDSVQTISTPREALQALEAFYHYSALLDYSQAAAVLLQARHNQWQQYLSLGSSLYRMGLHQPLLEELPQVIAHLPDQHQLCELHNILGDYYWTMGKVHLAIASQHQSLQLSTQVLEGPNLDPRHQHHFQIQVLDSRLSLGLYALDLWELEAAAQFFQQVIESAAHTVHQRWVPKASICLALTYSHMGKTVQARPLASHALGERLLETEQAARLAYFLQLLGQTHIYLGDLDQANTLFAQALTVAEASHYPQIQARTLTGCAIIHRYQGQFEAAVADHQQSIALLSQLNATCDLAEAYFQMGLTYRAMHQSCDRNHHFCQAIHLFQVMEAPCQVRRVTAQAGNLD